MKEPQQCDAFAAALALVSAAMERCVVF